MQGCQVSNGLRFDEMWRCKMSNIYSVIFLVPYYYRYNYLHIVLMLILIVDGRVGGDQVPRSNPRQPVRHAAGRSRDRHLPGPPPAAGPPVPGPEHNDDPAERSRARGARRRRRVRENLGRGDQVDARQPETEGPRLQQHHRRLQAGRRADAGGERTQQRHQPAGGQRVQAHAARGAVRPGAEHRGRR